MTNHIDTIKRVKRILFDLKNAEGLCAPHPNYEGRESSLHREGLLLDAIYLIEEQAALIKKMREVLEIYANPDLFDGSFYPRGYTEAEQALELSAPYAELEDL